MHKIHKKEEKKKKREFICESCFKINRFWIKNLTMKNERVKEKSISRGRGT